MGDLLGSLGGEQEALSFQGGCDLAATREFFFFNIPSFFFGFAGRLVGY